MFFVFFGWLIPPYISYIMHMYIYIYYAYIYIYMYFSKKTINIYLYTYTQNLRTGLSYLTFRLSPQGPLWAREPALGAPKDADLRRRLAQLFEESGGGAIAAAWVSVFLIGTHYLVAHPT